MDPPDHPKAGPAPASSDAVSTTDDSSAVLTPPTLAEPMGRPDPVSDSTAPSRPAPGTPTVGGASPRSSPEQLSRQASFSGSGSYLLDSAEREAAEQEADDWEALPPLDRLTLLDVLDNLALSSQLERLQRRISAQTQKVRRSREALRSRGQVARERMVEEWRRRVPSAEEQLDQYRGRMRQSVEKLGQRWGDARTITLREKISFLCGVMNIFLSGYLIGARPEWFHVWYTVQLAYFLPIRALTYHRRGYHYFLADLCYFVNVLLMLSMWVFPRSRRLFTAVYCLANGNNAVAIVMWRNSLVFHSFDKVTSLFIHIMPCAALHCIVHLLPAALRARRFPGAHAVAHSIAASASAHGSGPAAVAAASYGNIASMLGWSTIPYALWQMGYYFFITVRRRDKIAAGRPTSFTWLRRSYSRSWIGRLVLALPEHLQELAFMLIQYSYAVLTMLPCPIWFCSRWASATFLMVIFGWSVHNGAAYYIDIFGRRFEKELESMRAEVARWQGGAPAAEESSPSARHSPVLAPVAGTAADELGRPAAPKPERHGADRVRGAFDTTMMEVDGGTAAATGVDAGARDAAKERRAAAAAAAAAGGDSPPPLSLSSS